MGFWDSVKAMMKREASDLKAATDDLQQRLDADLGERERKLSESPEEAVERLQAEIDQSGSSFDELSDEIGRAAARSEAAADLEEAGEHEGTDPDDLDRGTA
jgi:hypothetical protein